MPKVDQDWCFYIGDKGSEYRVVPNPYSGGGACLLINRGIPCEFHVQIFSHHSSSCFPEDIKKAIEESSEMYVTAIDNMVTFTNSLPNKRSEYSSGDEYYYTTDWETREFIANTFFQSLIKNIVDRAEDICYQR